MDRYVPPLLFSPIFSKTEEIVSLSSLARQQSALNLILVVSLRVRMMKLSCVLLRRPAARP